MKVGISVSTQPARSVIDRLLSYNPSTGLLTRKVNSGPAKKGDIAGTINGKGYRDIRVNSSLCKAHRLAWCLHYGEYPNGEVDHINGVRDDNRIANLRVVTPIENMRNKRRYKNNASGVTGVRFRRGKWHVSIKDRPNHQKHIGVFRDFEAAVAARREAETRYGYHENHGATV